MSIQEDWQAVLSMESGYIAEEWETEDHISCMIRRGPSSLCAYLGVHGNHPIANKHPRDIKVPCHGGLNFSDRIVEGNWWYYGWDYAQPWDRIASTTFPDYHGTPWTVPMVRREIEEALPLFRQLMLEYEEKVEVEV